MISYRDAKLEDMPEIVSLIGLMHSETVWGGEKDFSYQPEKMAQSLYGFIKNQPETLARLALSDGRIIGIIIGDYGTMLFSEARQAR